MRLRPRWNATGDYRAAVQAGEVLDRTIPFSFSWDGAGFQAFAGDTIVSALAAAGVRVFSRSFKYHRPRGVLSASYLDPGCTVQVGDEPNVRGAHRRVEPGMVVEPQNVWPSLRYDAKSTNQLVAPFLSAGFYYKTFIQPQRLWPAYQKVLKRFAAGGRVSAATDSDDYYDQRYAHPDVLVAGGGPAGMSAALAAAEAGAGVMLVEEEYDLGGHLRWGDAGDLAALAQLRAAVQSEPGIEVLTNSVVTGRYDDNWLAVIQRRSPGGSGSGRPAERLVKARATTLVVAPGLVERPYVFDGNDRPGVMLSTAARRLINLYAVKPGRRAVVFSANAAGDAVVADLERVGVEIAAVVDARRGGDVRAALNRRGRAELGSVTLADGSSVECDLLVTAVGWTAPTSLLNMAGDRPVYRPAAARYFPGGDLPANVMVTGGIAGDGSIDELVAHARAVGAIAAARSGLGSGAPASLPALPVDEHPALFHGRTHGLVDFSEDVSSKDLVAAAAEGYDSIELVKRYTTVTMGPSQGKLETVNAVAILAAATGRGVEETGTTVWRPPYAPISLGALAGRRLAPVRHSPMQAWHEAHEARPLVAGQWIRPEHYGDPAGEVHNVRRNVGIIDVTPLGLLDLRGPDVPALLNLLYVNKWSRLPIGAVRYGVMCAEDGVILDDGVTGHLGDDQYLMSTTSSGAATVWEWVESWLQTEHPQWRVHVTPVTASYASINVAGPRARDLMARLVSDVDLAADRFPYMQVRSGTIAGVGGCSMWRIGFTGELSYEIHVPAGYGLYVWEALLAEGDDLGVKPFGIEAQRIMRLEKGHFIVGQDSDGLTQGFGGSLDGLIKLDKADFAGKPELVWQQQGDGGYQRLVGLQPLDPEIVPAESSLIVEGADTIVGRITSSRHSPTLGRSICLGFVAPHLSSPGRVVTVLLPDRTRLPVRIMERLAHFDPEGVRLRG